MFMKVPVPQNALDDGGLTYPKIWQIFGKLVF